MTANEPPLLPRRPLGNSGLSVSVLGLGTVAFGRQTGLKYRRPVERPNDSELLALLESARDVGINLLDTATAYGDSQQRLGELLPVISGERFLISTKVGERFAGQRSSFDFSAAAIEDDLALALQQLKRPAVDCVLLHSSGEDEAALCAGAGFEALLAARARGETRTIGLSAKTRAGIEAASAADADVLMVTLNRADQGLAAAIAAADKAGIGVLIKKPLASGYRRAEELAWVAAQPGVSSVVVGTTSVDHLQANAARLR